jgi:hypothetical protein
MNDQADHDRSIHAWLAAEAPDRAPDHLLAASRDRLRATSQRRYVDVTAFARLSIAAAIAVVAVVAITEWPPATGPIGSGVAAPPARSTTNTGPSPSAESSPFLWGDLPSATDLSTDLRYGTSTGLVSFSVPTRGWVHTCCDEIMKASSHAAFLAGEEPTATIFFREHSPDGVYADPCRQVRRDPVGRVTETDLDHRQHSADLADALATIPGTDLIEGPSDVTVGDLPAQHVAISVRDDTACAGGFFLWYDWDRPSRSASPGETISIWIVDYPRFRLRTWIEAEIAKDAAPDVDREIQQIVESIQFGG